jgi:hypothetical protein
VLALKNTRAKTFNPQDCHRRFLRISGTSLVYRSRKQVIVLGNGWFWLAQDVEDEFSASRDAQFFKDTRQAILYRVLTEAQFFR